MSATTPAVCTCQGTRRLVIGRGHAAGPHAVLCCVGDSRLGTKTCGWHGEWMTLREATLLVDALCAAMRDHGEQIDALAAETTRRLEATTSPPSGAPMPPPPDSAPGGPPPTRRSSGWSGRGS